MIYSRNNKNKKCIVAMSGGVDSSVAAALLKEKGYDVIGIFMHLWSDKSVLEDKYYKLENKCCSFEAYEQAKKVAQRLNIPFYSLNFEKDFKNFIVDYFIMEYKKGRTPNPCVMCNKKIKFDFLLDKALRLGAEHLATGHYARIEKHKEGKRDIYKLLKGRDKTKDQSYFLWTLNQNKLKHLLFPIGNYTKRQVRKLAKKFALPTAERKESQGICFILEKDHNKFLKHYIKSKKGLIIDTKGKVLGEHYGLFFYTIGQRHGLGLGSGKSFYVAKLDIKNNVLVVTENEKNLYLKNLVAGGVNWISGSEPKLPLRTDIQIRYRQKSFKGFVNKIQKNRINKQYLVKFIKPQRAITPGQTVVFYKNNDVLGGGVIKK